MRLGLSDYETFIINLLSYLFLIGMFVPFSNIFTRFKLLIDLFNLDFFLHLRPIPT